MAGGEGAAAGPAAHYDRAVLCELTLRAGGDARIHVFERTLVVRGGRPVPFGHFAARHWSSGPVEVGFRSSIIATKIPKAIGSTTLHREKLLQHVVSTVARSVGEQGRRARAQGGTHRAVQSSRVSDRVFTLARAIA